MALTYVKSSGIDSTGNYTVGNITATANITAAYVIGNGSQLTGLPASYSDSNVAAYLPTYTGNISANYFIGNGSQLTGLPASYSDSNVAAYLSTAANITLGNVANIHISGGDDGQVLSTDGTGNLSWITTSSGVVTRKYVADGTGKDYTITTGKSVDTVFVFINGICQAPTDDYTISGTTLSLDAVPASGSKIQIREF